MERIFTPPNIVLSRCIEFDPCRYNGDIIRSPIVHKLKAYVHFIPVCPEIEIGLGIPRETLRIVRIEGEDHLMQPGTGKDVSKEMTSFVNKFLDSLYDIEGFILKTKSPTSGLKGVKVYPAIGKSAPIDLSAGFFAREIIRRYPFFPVEDEGRLRNVRILDHFLTSVFCLAEFREVKNSGEIKRLVKFHTRNKYLLMAHNQTLLPKMGKVAANPENLTFVEITDSYQDMLYKALSRAPGFSSNINILLHALGRISSDLSPAEKGFFLDYLQKYREGHISICAPKNMIRMWIIRFEDSYLAEQTYFAPYPENLIEPDPYETDRGKDFWDKS
ncbi:MAG TPA: DUF523 and DUF1722 domain-containing protein [Methanoregulaceae archaeon]|nr:DUF523 and DUF1722 domain-containing protein [Methanoregulaceae archaeon]